MKNRHTPLRLIFLFLVLLSLGGVGIADEAATAERFENAKASEPELIAFVKDMPKGADLHVHLSGAVYAETLLDAAIRSPLFFDADTCRFVPAGTAGAVPARTMLEDPKLATRFLDTISMRGWYPGCMSGHDHFFDTWSHMNGPMDDKVMLAEILSRARAQNLQYMEIMAGIGPGDAHAAALANPPFVGDLDKALAEMKKRFPALIRASKTFLDSLDSTVAKRMGVEAPITAAKGPIFVRYIYCINRNLPNRDFFARMACGMALVRADPRIVACNILAPEDYTPARWNFDEQMRMIDFLWNRMGKPDMTLHAGELTLKISPVEVMRSRIRKTIELGHAKRIGHGVSIAWEDDLPGLLKEMRDKRVAVEICLSSNDIILGVSGDRHPFRLYRKAGIPMNLNTDDEGVGRSNITMEFIRAIRNYDLSYADLKELARNSLEYAFLPGESLYVGGDYTKLHPAFAAVRAPGWSPSEEAKTKMAASEKLATQVRLERAFVEFEK
jgi:adenosine deaminase